MAFHPLNFGSSKAWKVILVTILSLCSLVVFVVVVVVVVFLFFFLWSVYMSAHHHIGQITVFVLVLQKINYDLN